MGDMNKTLFFNRKDVKIVMMFRLSHFLYIFKTTSKEIKLNKVGREIIEKIMFFKYSRPV